MLEQIEVLSIRKAKAKDKYVIITNNQEYVWSEDTIVKYSILKGRVLTNEDLEEVLKYENKNTAFQKAIKYISFQMRSTNEVIKNLEKCEYDQDTISFVITRLSDLSFLDDEAYCKNQLDYAINNKKGPNWLKQKLQSKYIEKKQIELVVRLYPEDVEEQLIKEIVDKIGEKNKHQPVKKQQLALRSKLVRDGFSTSIISKVLGTKQYTDESESLIPRHIEKLNRKYDKLDSKTKKQKIYQNLLLKGYDYAKISKYIDNE